MATSPVNLDAGLLQLTRLRCANLKSSNMGQQVCRKSALTPTKNDWRLILCASNNHQSSLQSLSKYQFYRNKARQDLVDILGSVIFAVS